MHYATIYMYNHMNAGDKVTDFENTFATYKEMTRTHPNQSLNTLISLLILCSTWQFRPFPKFRHFRKPQNTSTKNISSKSALLILTVSTSAFHSTNLFLFSRHHIPTVIAWLHFLHINPYITHNSSNCSVILSHRRITTVSLKT